MTITKNNFKGTHKMKKNKFLVYLLSTALITPTFATQTAFAEDSSNKNTNSDKMEQHQSQKETSKQSEKMNLTTMILNTILMIKALLTARTKTLINHYQLTQHIVTIK